MMTVGVLEQAPAIVGALVDTDSAGAGTNYSFTMDFGVAATERTLVAVISLESTADRTINSVTIGGVSATIAGSARKRNLSVVPFGVIQDQVAIYKASVPTGTSGTVAVSLSGAATVMHAALYRVLSASTEVAGGAQGGDDAKTTLAVQSGDFLIAGGCSRGAFSATMVGVVEEWDEGAPTRHAGGSYSPVASATLAVEAHFIDGDNSVMACAAFRA